MEVQYLLKIGEMSLKGGNIGFFEKRLKDSIRKPLSGKGIRVEGRHGRFFVYGPESDKMLIEDILDRTFGLVGYSRVYSCAKDIDKIKSLVLTLAKSLISEGSSFKAETRRADKGFFMSSYQLACQAGSWISDAYPETRVDVKNPDWKINIEIRDKAYVYGKVNPCPGGMPQGSAGKGILLLSGGIDSPVAGYLMGKRGLKVEGIYYHAYPYTSDEALDKVKTLASRIARFNGGFILHVVPFTDVQLELKRKAAQEDLTLHLRACMMKAADITARRRRGLALITGESLSQVASQTSQSLRYTNSFTDFPVFRPCIGMDKQEIIKIARKIDTFETSILPYEDCCTIFSPKHPTVRPDFYPLKDSFGSMDMDESINSAIESTTLYKFNAFGKELDKDN